MRCSVRYPDFRIRSFPRSGNCYLKYLILHNFWGAETVEGGRVNHEPMRTLPANRSMAFFYLWRRFEPAAESLYRVRQRFGFNTEVDWDDFITKPLDELPKVDGPCDWKVNRVTYTEEACSVQVRQWLNVHKTLYEVWEEHVRLGMSAARAAPNVMLVSHEQLLDEFEVMMLSIADFLGSDKREFDDTYIRVGLTCIPDAEKKPPEKRYVKHDRVAPIPFVQDKGS